MIPKRIHYCWFGQGDMPVSTQRCIASWHDYMPDYEYKLWDEKNFDVRVVPYVKEAYEAKKYAFVSDFVRLWALEKEGGVYFDTDVMVFKSFDDLLEYKAFVGFEGSKQLPVGTCVMATEAHGVWIREMFDHYKDRHFLKADGSFDLTTNVQFISAKMCENGFVQDGKEQDYKDLHVFPMEYFSPRQTTGEYLRTSNTYSDHLGLGSWMESAKGWKYRLGRLVGKNNMTKLIKLKRKLFG